MSLFGHGCLSQCQCRGGVADHHKLIMMRHVIRKVKSIIVSDSGDGDPDRLFRGIPSTGNNTVIQNTPVANNDPNSPHELPENILAFRTITTLLAKIQQASPTFSNEIEKLAEDDIDKETLRISTAFGRFR